MDKQWKGLKVTVVRDARTGDQGYMGDHQVIVCLEDGTEATASRIDVTDRVEPPVEEAAKTAPESHSQRRSKK